MDPQLLVILLLLAGFGLMIAELFLPSGGLIALMCVGCFAASVYYAYQAWWENYPAYWWSYIASLIVLIPLGIAGGFQLLTRTSLGNNILLAAPTAEEVTPYQSEEQFLSGFLGKSGTAISPLLPGGMVKVDGERLHAFTEGLVIEAGTPIVVVGVRGTRVLVEPQPATPDENGGDQTDPAWIEDDLLAENEGSNESWSDDSPV